MAEKSRALSVTGIIMYKRITREVEETNMLSYYIVQLRDPSSIHIVAGK